MKATPLLAGLLVILMVHSDVAALTPRSSDGRYVIIGWNDLGMHCISPRFSEMAILPPANNFRAVVIRRAGETPSMVTSGVTVTYALINNKSVAGKTDFWNYEDKLFGVSLSPGVGLAGFGLSGSMAGNGDHFEANLVPVLPYLDNLAWNPFQQAVLTLNVSGRAVASTTIVVPVSEELNCIKCHKTGGLAGKGIKTPTLEGNILTLHDQREGTHLMASRPVLCASCHSDNALGMKGSPGVTSLSYAMHTKHSWSIPEPACYDCHPGSKTQCNRSAIAQMGPVAGDPKCENCHGTLDRMAVSLRAGRNPWLNEPDCASCHGPLYSTGTQLYRNAKGHGGIYCVVCHNSPHAWYPSLRAVDNAQPLAVQGSKRSIGYYACIVCHTDGRRGSVPPHAED